MRCLNCDGDINEELVFCPTCGQKTKYSISVRALISNFFGNIFNLDSKFFQTIPRLFIPAQLSFDYIKGYRKKYYSPGRVFFISMLAFFGLFTTLINQSEDLDRLNNWQEKVLINQMLTTYDSLTLEMIPDQLDQSASDTLRSKIFSKHSKVDLSMDNGVIKFNMNGQNVDTIPDSLATVMNRGAFDLLTLSPEEYVEKKKVKIPFAVFVIAQWQKLIKDVKGSISFIISNLIWAIFILVFLTALLLKLLYIRSGRFYVEHVIFQMHFISASFWMLNIYLILKLLNLESAEWILLVAVLTSSLFLFLALKKILSTGLLQNDNQIFYSN